MSKRVVALVADLYEDLELWYPKLRFEEAGWKVTIAAPEEEQTYRGKHGYPCFSDASVADVNSSAFDLLLIPGGYSPDRLRQEQDVLRLTREFHDAGKPIAFICHGGWVLVSAKILSGRRLTSYVAIKDDMVNAGATWVDEPVVVDGHLISSRTPADLPQFARAAIDWFAAARV